MESWQTQAEGAEAADQVIAYVEEVAEFIRKGKVHKARRRLDGRGWARGSDLDAVPPEVLARTQRLVDAAWDGLRRPPLMPDASLGVLTRIRQMYTH